MAVAHRGERWVQRSGEIISRQEGPKKTLLLCQFLRHEPHTNKKGKEGVSQSQRLLNSVLYIVRHVSALAESHYEAL